MSYCTSCGYPRNRPGPYCRACGAELPVPAAPSDAAPSDAAPSGRAIPPEDPADPFASLYAPRAYGPSGADRSGDPEPGGVAYADPGRTGGSPPDLVAAPRRGWGRPVLAAVIVLAVLAAAAGAGLWLTRRHQPSAAQAGPAAAPRVTRTVTPVASAAPSSSPPPTSAPTATSAAVPTPTPNSGLVTVVPGAAQEPDATGVTAFLGRYFTAIDHHDYPQYAALLAPRLRQDFSAQDFARGYRTTRDSAATLTGISRLGSGHLAAAVTFTSRQSAADSPTGTRCTDWQVTLYLQRRGGQYLLGHPPGGYHARYQAC